MRSPVFGKKMHMWVISLLALVMLLSLCFVASAANHATMTTEFTLDTSTMSRPGSGVSIPINDNFKWMISGPNAGFNTVTTNGYTGKALIMKNDNFTIYDNNDILDAYKAIAISFDIYFDAFPTAKAGADTSPDPTSDNFKNQSLVAWLGESYEGLRIDSNGDLYSDVTQNSKLDVKLNKKTWYNIKLIYSQSNDKLELWLDGTLVATAPMSHKTSSSFIRIFDGAHSYNAFIRNIALSTTNDFYYSGLTKEASSDTISYQTTKPAADGSFKLRILAGINTRVDYKLFGYRVIMLTKDALGNTVEKEMIGTDKMVYSAVYGDGTLYSIKETFGYEYAGLATVTGLDSNEDIIELIIYPYTISTDNNKIYGTPVALAYTGEKDANGYPQFHISNKTTEIVAEADTCLDVARSDTNIGADNLLIVRNTGDYKTADYRAGYFKFTIPAETAAELDEMANIYLNVYISNIEVREGREKQNICVFGATSNWTEDNTYSDFYNRLALGSLVISCTEKITGARGSVLDTIPADEYFGSSYLVFDVLDYVKGQTKNSDGSITVSFCVTHEDNNGNASAIYLRTREAAGYEPKLVLEKSLYHHAVSNEKTENAGYEPLSYAETLVDAWFDEIYDKVYPTDQSGNLVYHDELDGFGTDTLVSLDPNTETSGDGSNNAFSWDLGGNAGISEVSIGGYSGKAFILAPGQYYFYDTNGILTNYNSVAFKFDLCFDELPTMSSGSSTSPDPSSSNFKPQAILAWLGNSYDGLRIDANGNLYSSTTASSALGVKLTTDTWYSLEVVFSNQTETVSCWLNGKCVATASYAAVTASDYIRLFDGSNTYNAFVKNISLSVPNGYAATTATGDFKEELSWKGSSAWSTSVDANGNYIVSADAWMTDKFARTLSTLGTSKANAFLNSSYASTPTEYDIYGGITNAGFKGTATGYFHTEKHTDGRTYVIDPLGNPYFAVSVNQLNLGDTNNHKTYSLDQYETKDAYFEQITASLKDIGINTAFVSDSDSILGVENGLNVVVGVTGVGAYMAKLGRSQVKEGTYPNNNTINVFDPDFQRLVNKRNAELIQTNGYADNKNIFAYSADNELPAGVTVLYRYLTLDPTVPENAFSYHTAWTWFARRMGSLNPSIGDYFASNEQTQLNSEFLSFLYTTYYTTIRNSIEAVDKNHMYLGSRANDTCITDEGHLRAAGYCLDIITLNLYGGLNPSAETISNIYKYSGKPFIVSEFFAKGLDAIDANGYKLANSTGAGILVYTQEDRADYYENYVLNLLESKACVGWSWYRFRDNDQSLYTATLNGSTLTDLRMLYVMYTDVSYPGTLMDKAGTVYTLSDLGCGQYTWNSVLTQTYKGEALASNQNVNKGIYNSNFSSTVTVYSYKADGTLDTTADPYSMGSQAFEVVDPASENVEDGTVLTSLDGTKTFTLGKKTNADGSYTVTVLTTYKGKYLALSQAIQNISDNIMGIVRYFDAN